MKALRFLILSIVFDILNQHDVLSWICSWYEAACRTWVPVGSQEGGGLPGGVIIWKRCKTQTRIRKSSMRARLSPTHCLLPMPKGSDFSIISLFKDWPSSERNRSGLNSSGEGNIRSSHITVPTLGIRTVPLAIFCPPITMGWLVTCWRLIDTMFAATPTSLNSLIVYLYLHTETHLLYSWSCLRPNSR